jgi:hypothetical protein
MVVSVGVVSFFHPQGSRAMRVDVVKVLLIAAAVSALSACSGAGGLTTTSCFSADCQSPQGRNNATTLKFGGNSIGSSLNQYSSGMLHDD